MAIATPFQPISGCSAASAFGAERYETGTSLSAASGPDHGLRIDPVELGELIDHVPIGAERQPRAMPKLPGNLDHSPPFRQQQ